jgi:hypothetical protein
MERVLRTYAPAADAANDTPTSEDGAFDAEFTDEDTK